MSSLRKALGAMNPLTLGTTMLGMDWLKKNMTPAPWGTTNTTPVSEQDMNNARMASILAPLMMKSAAFSSMGNATPTVKASSDAISQGISQLASRGVAPASPMAVELVSKLSPTGVTDARSVLSLGSALYGDKAQMAMPNLPTEFGDNGRSKGLEMMKALASVMALAGKMKQAGAFAPGAEPAAPSGPTYNTGTPRSF